MRNILFSILIATIGFSCAPQKEEVKNPESLVGTWKRVKYVDNEVSDTSWRDQLSEIIYLKHITPTHFTWLSFDTKTDMLNGAGGGTYQYDGKTYTENIEFFYPTGSSLLGQSIPFSVHFEDGKWHHTGYIQNPEIDPEQAEVIATDSSKVDEIWEKIKQPEGQNADLIGTWQLVSYKNRKDSTRIEYPTFIEYYKLITPSHFTWIQVNKDINEISALGGGTYDFDGTTYTEHILYHHPEEEALRGITVPFDFEMKDSLWYHKGLVVRPKLDRMGNEVGKDTLMVDEIWKKWRAK